METNSEPELNHDPGLETPVGEQIILDPSIDDPREKLRARRFFQLSCLVVIVVFCALIIPIQNIIAMENTKQTTNQLVHEFMTAMRDHEEKLAYQYINPDARFTYQISNLREIREDNRKWFDLYESVKITSLSYSFGDGFVLSVSQIDHFDIRGEAAYSDGDVRVFVMDLDKIDSVWKITDFSFIN